jgi:hypothetical protein
VPLGLRVTLETKRRLDDAAVASGRSQSQEAELRLEHSFDREDLLIDILKLAYGEQLAGLVLLIAGAMHDAGVGEAFAKTSTPEEAWNWLEAQYPYDQAQKAATAILAALRPEGASWRPGELKADRGEALADVFLREIATGLTRFDNRKDRVAQIRELLGRDAVSRLKQSLRQSEAPKLFSPRSRGETK